MSYLAEFGEAAPLIEIICELQKYLVANICLLESCLCFKQRETFCYWSGQFSSEKNITSKSWKCTKKLTSNPLVCPRDWGGCDLN